MMKICSAGGCGKESKVNGWCSLHYERWRAKTPERMAYRKRYRNSDEGKAATKKYSLTPKARESSKRWSATPAGKESHRLAAEKFRATPAGEALRQKNRMRETTPEVRELRRRYRYSEAGRASQIRSYLKFKKSPNYLEKINNNAKKFFASPRGKFSMYRYAARKGGKDFNISFAQFMVFWQKPCAYCGVQIEKIGLDRVDNSVGYNLENIVPCCRNCNFTKRNWTKEFFIKHCSMVAAFNSK